MLNNWQLILPTILFIHCDLSFVNIRDDARNSDCALLIVSGAYLNSDGRQSIEDYFPRDGLDVFLVDSRQGSMDNAVKKIADTIEEYDLHKYNKLYALTYIIGSWAFNLYLQDHKLNNLNGIIYDRSPIQERTTAIVLEKIPTLVSMKFGDLLVDLRDTPYPKIENTDELAIGIIIESRASEYAIKHKKEVMKAGELDWRPTSLNQDFDDYLYTYLNHEMMYYRFDEIGDEITYFMTNHQFPTSAPRSPLSGDPFSRWEG